MNGNCAGRCGFLIHKKIRKSEGEVFIRMGGRTRTLKRLIPLLLAVLLAIPAGCGKSDDDGKAAENGGSPAPSASAETDNTPITFTFFSSDPSPNWNNMQDEVGKVITEKTGVTLKAEFSTGNEDKVALIAASGNYPDLISPKNGASLLVNDGGDTLFTEINPGNTLTGVIVFDIPENAGLARVELHDSAFSGGVSVDLT